MNKIVFVLFCLLASVEVYAHKKCGTISRPRNSNPNARVEEGCFTSNPCDVPATRDTYIKSSNSATLKLRVNSIVFADLSNTEIRTAYESNMAFFVTKYRDLLGIDVIYNTTVVTSEYQSTDSEDKATHIAMARKYYRQGWMTVLFTQMTSVGDEQTLGYASALASEVPSAIEEWYTIMTITSLGPAGTTVPHEVGHMLGLLHVFMQESCPAACNEAVNAPNRNLVGDLCADTLPMGNEQNCNGTLTIPEDCNGDQFLTAYSYADLPLTNFMAYTDDACQTVGFTAQQSGRARCYLSTTLSFLSTETPSSNTPSKVSSATQLVAAGLGSLAAVALML